MADPNPRLDGARTALRQAADAHDVAAKKAREAVEAQQKAQRAAEDAALAFRAALAEAPTVPADSEDYPDYFITLEAVGFEIIPGVPADIVITGPHSARLKSSEPVFELLVEVSHLDTEPNVANLKIKITKL